MDALVLSIDIPDAETYVCSFGRYLRGLSQWHLSARHPVNGDTFYIAFYTVVYYEGPLGWQNAKFNVAPKDECLEILRRIGWFNNVPENIARADFQEYSLEHFRLYKVETSCGVVRVLAENMWLLEHEPKF